MDTPVLILAAMTAIMIVVAFQTRRIGNEIRDVALLAAFGGLFAAGTALAAIL